MRDSKGQADERWRVVLVDDDENYLRDYSRGMTMFTSGYQRGRIDIDTFSDPAEALLFVKNTPQQRSLWILDSMMPYGEDFDQATTRTGLLTGVTLLKKIRQVWPCEQTVWFLIVTNYSKADIENMLGEVRTKGIYNKLSCSPKALAALVDQITG